MQIVQEILAPPESALERERTGLAQQMGAGHITAAVRARYDALSAERGRLMHPEVIRRVEELRERRCR